MADPHITARTAATSAAWAITRCGVHSPTARALLAVASHTAEAAWEAGHRVTDTHPLRSRTTTAAATGHQ